MKERTVTFESILFLTAILVAFCIRFINLGQAALGDAEAALALHAKTSASMQASGEISNPLYVNVTSDIFGLFGTGNFGARFLSAFAGSILCIAPLLLRKRIGTVPALCTTFILALEPSLVAASRQGGSLMPAMAALVFAIIFLVEKRSILAGIAFGLLLLTGTDAWQGIAIVGITLLIWSIVISLFPGIRTPSSSLASSDEEVNKRKFNPVFFISTLLMSLLVFGSNFFTRFGNMSGIIGGFIGYLRSWVIHSAIWLQTLEVMLAAILIYGLFSLIFGITGFLKNFQSGLSKILLIDFIIAIILILFFPSHSTLDSAWIMLPLAFSSGLIIANIFRFEKKDSIVQICVSVIFFALLIFAWLNAIWILQNLQADPSNSKIHLAASIGALILLVVVLLLVMWGWSWRTAKKALLFSSGLFLLLFSFSMTRRAAGYGSFPETSPFLESPRISGADLLVKTIGDISSRENRIPEGTDILVTGSTPDSLKWSLRDFEYVTYEDTLSPRLSPSFLITFTQDEPKLNASYRGQKFTWQISPDWTSMEFIDWFNWVALQESPTLDHNLYLWARNDLFPSVFISENNFVE